VRSTSEIMAALIATGLNPEQIALMAELTASATASAVPPETPEERRKRISRETSARHRASHSDAKTSPDVTTPRDAIVSPNVTKRHAVTQSDAGHIESFLSLKVVEEKRESKKEARGSRIVPEWAPSDRDRLYAVERRFSDDQIAGMAAHFVNYWLAKSGRDSTKVDWSATWRNWVTSQFAPKPEGRNGYVIDPDAFV
jgi:hypothetical protein